MPLCLAVTTGRAELEGDGSTWRGEDPVYDKAELFLSLACGIRVAVHGNEEGCRSQGDGE